MGRMPSQGCTRRRNDCTRRRNHRTTRRNHRTRRRNHRTKRRNDRTERRNHRTGHRKTVEDAVPSGRACWLDPLRVPIPSRGAESRHVRASSMACGAGPIQLGGE